MSWMPQQRRPDRLDVENEPSVLGMVVSRLNDLASQLRHLDAKTDRRFDGLDDKLDEIADGSDKRLTALETDKEISEAFSDRKVRASDRKRHWIVTGVGVAATLGGGALAVLIQHAVGG